MHDMSSTSGKKKQAWKIVRFQRHLPLTIQFYISCRITGVPPLQSDFSGLSSALKDDTIEPRLETPFRVGVRVAHWLRAR